MNKLYDDYQSVIVSFYVENVPLAANTVHTVKIIFYISETLPFGLLCSFEPMFQWYLCVIVLLVKIK
jgi:hypothetical protein